MENLEFLLEAGKLKHLARTGWKLRGIKNPESVADHSWRLALMAMIFCDGLDKLKCIEMALIHDLLEAIAGDIPPEEISGIAKEEKERREKEAAKSLFSGTELLDIWEEYLENKTLEAKLVHDLDKLEMAIQAVEYMKLGYSGLEEFLEYTERNLETETGKRLFEIIKTRYKNLKTHGTKL